MRRPPRSDGRPPSLPQTDPPCGLLRVLPFWASSQDAPFPHVHLVGGYSGVDVSPERSYLVCATPRSGSTLLCHLLDQTGVAGRPEEYFEALRHYGVLRKPHEYFDAVRHANIIERLAFRELPDGVERPANPLWGRGGIDRLLALAL